MIPRWLANARHETCVKCGDKSTCTVQYDMLRPAPKCPLGKLPSLDDAIAERAWPSSAPKVSGCCDSAVNYL